MVTLFYYLHFKQQKSSNSKTKTTSSIIGTPGVGVGALFSMRALRAKKGKKKQENKKSLKACGG